MFVNVLHRVHQFRECRNKKQNIYISISISSTSVHTLVQLQRTDLNISAILLKCFMKQYLIFAFVVANKHNIQDSFQVQNDAENRV